VGGLPSNADFVGDAFGNGGLPAGLRGCISSVSITEESVEPFPAGKRTTKQVTKALLQKQLATAKFVGQLAG